MVTRNLNDIHFGGPDLPPARLRDLLSERVAAVPSGGTIDWVTYYFRDRRLAEELLRARRRGVRVTVTLEGRPRSDHANDAVVAMISGPDGLGDGLRTVSQAGIPTLNGKRWKTHLHTKLYCFSQPKPVAYIGSFNPSGDNPELDPDIIHEIGDHDRGHNVLVGLYDPVLVTCLMTNARCLYRMRYVALHRFSILANRKCVGKNTGIHFWPRMSPHPVKKFLNRLGSGARIRIAASHIKGKSIAKVLIGFVRQGAKLEILADSTQRRVPAAIEKMLLDAGILFRRVNNAEGLPMHHKFILVEKNNHRWVIFGSFNWSTRSYWLNHEIAAISTDQKLFAAFAERWEAMSAQAGLR